jgi:hypothetical protein
MRRSIVVMMVIGLLAGMVAAAPAEAKKRKVTRKAQGTYQAPATVVGNCTQTDGIGCMTIPAGPKERYITATVTDAHGQPVVIEVTADLDGDIQTETSYGSFCGTTEDPIKIEPGVSLVFWVGRADNAAAEACLPGVATSGTLDVTFSNLP